MLFTPAWWTISFPIAALVNAVLKYAMAHPSRLTTVLAIALLFFLTVALLLLAVQTLATVRNGKRLAG